MICCVDQSFVLSSLPICVGTGLNTNVLIGLSAAAGVACISGLWLAIRRRPEQAPAKAAPPLQVDQKSHQFLDEMSDQVALTEDEEALLITMTEELDLTSPALLFVEPKHLQARSRDESDGAECALLLLPTTSNQQPSTAPQNPYRKKPPSTAMHSPC